MGQFAGKGGLADTRFTDEKRNFTGGENEFYAFIGICKVQVVTPISWSIFHLQ